jgi:AraC-like DNA-binding protein
MRPTFEKVNVEAGASWSLLNRRLDDGIPFEWHHHPEFELTLTLNSQGHRLVGDHTGQYDDGDLVLVGPGLPHSWCSRRAINPRKPHIALVAWFTELWAARLLDLFPELGALSTLFSDARSGVEFSPAAVSKVRPLLETLPDVDAPARLLILMETLQVLARDPDRKRLSETLDDQFLPATSDERIRRVLDHLHKHFDEPVVVPQLAEIACLSQATLNRLFKRHTRQTPMEYVMRLRIGRACSALMEGRVSIAAAAYLAGYHSLANFNRQFLALKGMTPRDFRALHARAKALPQRR